MQYYINAHGKLSPIQYSLDYSDTKSDMSMSLEKVLIYPVTDEYTALLSCLTDSLEIIDKQTLQLLINEPAKMNKETHNYYSVKFPGNSKEAELRFSEKENYHKDILAQKKDSCVSFIICPTYGCNMKCVYCYQHPYVERANDKISMEKLSVIFNYMEKEISRLETLYGKRAVTLELFGGEPLQEHLLDTVGIILEHARKKNYLIIITTNGLQLELYLPLIEKYRDTIARVYTNLDGIQPVHDQRRKSNDRTSDSGFLRIVKNINEMRKFYIPITVATNLDKNNIAFLGSYFDYVNHQGWLNNDLITIELGRVDDRFYSGFYNNCMSEAELLHRLVDYNREHPFPKNVKLAFLKTTEFISRVFGFNFNQDERGRGQYHYCWATTPLDDVYYIDNNLDIYRCTYSVGNKDFKLGNVNVGCLSSAFSNHGFFQNKECASCSIGKYCSGGCYISSQTSWDRHCTEEKANFDYFMKRIVVPEIRSKLHKLFN